MYILGHPDDALMQRFKPGEYETEDDAIKAAQAQQRVMPFDGLIAVYEQDSMFILAIVHNGIVYRPD